MTGLNPNQLAHISNGTVTITQASPTGIGPLAILIVPADVHNNFIGRYKVYFGSGPTIKALAVADGFSTTSTAYEMIDAQIAQIPTPRTIVMGKRELGDIAWSSTLQAILDDVPNGEAPPYFGIKIDSVDKAELLDASQWVLNTQSNLENGPSFLFLGETKDLAVLTAQNGNVVETMAAQSAGNLGSNGTASLAWSDLTRVQKPAQLQTKKQTFNLNPIFGVPLFMAWIVNNGPMQILFFDATQALVQGNGPFPANLAPGDNLDLEIDGFAFSAIFNATAATITSGVAEPYAPLGGETFSVFFENVETPIALLGTDTTAADIALNINTAVGAIVAFDDAGFVRLTSTILGTNSSVRVQEGTGGNAILQFSTSLVKGTGNVGNIDAVTLTEAINVIQNSTQTAAIIFGSTILNIQSATYGTGSTVEILNTSSANLLTEFGLVVGLTLGSGFAANTAATTATEVETVFVTELIDVVHDSTTGRVISTTIAKGNGTSINLVSPQVQILELTPDAGQNIGFKYDSLNVLSVVSVDAATDAAALKALFDADNTYTAIGQLEIGPDDTLRFIAVDNGIHEFANASDPNAQIVALDSGNAYSALGYTDLLAQGSGVARGYIDLRLFSRLFSYADPDLEHQQRPTDLVTLNPAPPTIQHSGITRDEMLTVVNGDGNNKYGAWVLDVTNDSATYGTQMVNKIKIQTYLTAVLIKNTLVRETVNFLKVNAQAGIFVGLDEETLNSIEGLYTSILNQYVIGKHIRPLKDFNDPTFDPARDSTLIMPKFSSLNPVDIQQGVIRGIQMLLVAVAPLQGIYWDVNLVAATQPNAF